MKANSYEQQSITTSEHSSYPSRRCWAKNCMIPVEDMGDLCPTHRERAIRHQQAEFPPYLKEVDLEELEKKRKLEALGF